MAIFDRLDRMTSRVVDRQFSVSATILPMKASPNGRPRPDPARGEIICRGVYDTRPMDAAIEEGNRDRRGNEFQSIVSGDRIEFSVDCRRYPEATNVVQGDRLVLDDARRFVIDAVQPDGQSRVVLVLSKA